MDGAQLLRSASAGKVAGSSAVLERHAARVDDLAQAVLGERRAPLAGAVATFVDTSVRLSALQEDDPLARWLVAVNRSPETLEKGPAVMHRDPVPLRGSASDRQDIAEVAQPRPAPAPEPAPPVPAVVLKVAQQRPPRRVRAEVESVPAPDAAPAPPSPDDLDLAAARERGAGAGESRPRSRRRRLVGVPAGLALALLLGAFLLRAADIERRTALTASPTSTSAGAEGPRTVVLIPPVDAGVPPAAPTVPAAPVSDATPTTAPPVPTTTTSTAAGAGGVLFPTLETVGLPSVDPTTGVARGSLPLQNRGSTPLTYATRSSFGGLTVDKPTGTIAPRATTVLAVTLDGAKAGEGRFAGTLSFDRPGGTEQVAVTSTVGRPPVIKAAGESCAPGNPSCSPLVRLEPGTSAGAAPSPCTTSWRYSVTVEDESRLKSVRAVANLAGRGVVLKRAGATSAGAGLWQSDVLPPLRVPASLSFSINAVDEFDFGRTEATPRSIEC